MSEWKTIPLSETTKFIVDNRGKTAPTAPDGIPLIATNCINNNSLFPTYENVRYVSEETYKTWFRAHPMPGDIILTLKGSQNGAVCLVPDPVDFAIAQDMVALRIDDSSMDPHFVFAALRSSEVQQEIKNLDVSGVIPHLKKSDFDKLHLPCPDLNTQRAIGNIYYCMSMKIDLLQLQNRTLESMTETLFQQWLVGDGETRTVLLGDIIEIHDSRRIPLSSTERDKMKVGPLYPYYGAANVMDHINDYIFDGEFLLLGEDGTVQTSAGFPILQLAVGKYWVNNHAHVLKAKEPFSTFLLHSILKKTSISHIITGAVQPKINQENLKSLEIEVPCDERILELVSETSRYWQKIQLNNIQVQTLESLRDTLLPKLLSGDVRVAL
jgi:type I restriction enzyme S subunit